MFLNGPSPLIHAQIFLERSLDEAWVQKAFRRVYGTEKLPVVNREAESEQGVAENPIRIGRQVAARQK